MSLSGKKSSKAQSEKYEEIIHGYIHGELCKLINQRHFLTDTDMHKKRIIANCRLLVKTLMCSE